MSFIARELDRIGSRLRELHPSDLEYEKLYAAQQALSWALEPTGFKAPYDMIMGTPEGSEDCSARSHPPLSSDTIADCESQSPPIQSAR